MQTLHLFTHGLLTALAPINLLMLVAGITMGMVVGAIPGISAANGIALLLPLTQIFGFAPETVLILFAGVYYGSKYGGRVPAILQDVPGDVSSLGTWFEGYPLARAGAAGRALILTAVSSFIGGSVAVVALVFLGGLFVTIGNFFGPPEYAVMILFVFVLVLTLSATPLVKSLISLCLGLMFSVVGLDWGTGAFRFTANIPDLFDGIDFLIVVIGIFAMSETFLMMVKEGPDRKPLAVTDRWHNPLPECLRLKWTLVRSSLIGTVIGILPGTGTVVANLAAYRLERKIAKDSQRFGSGDPRGLIAPEAANSACAFAAFVPLMALGIPGSATTAVLHGALLLMNIDPGPALCRNQPQIIWAMIASMGLGNVLLLVFNVPLVRYFPRILAIPGWVLMPVIVVVSFVSVYTVHQSMVSLLLMVVISFFAYGLRTFRYPLAPLILGYVLGKPVEDNFRLALAVSSGDLGIFARSGPAMALWACIAASILIAISIRIKR